MMLLMRFTVSSGHELLGDVVPFACGDEVEEFRAPAGHGSTAGPLHRRRSSHRDPNA
jgi:hypothetical protein